jgi:hypothetical protein
MAEPDRPPGHRSLFHFGVKRVAEKQPAPEVDRAEVERYVGAKRQARKQREQDAAAAAWAGRRVGGGRRSRPLPSRAGRGRGWSWTRDMTGRRVGGGAGGGLEGREWEGLGRAGYDWRK